MFLDGHLSVFILNLEEPSFPTSICIICSLIFLALVFVDKKIKFHKVIGIEHMLRMKNFSTSDLHFRRSIFLYIAITAVLVSMCKKMFIFIYPRSKLVCHVKQKKREINFYRNCIPSFALIQGAIHKLRQPNKVG